MRPLIALSPLLVLGTLVRSLRVPLVLAFWLGSTACSSGGGGSVPPLQPLEFTMSVTSPPAQGVQVGRPFSLKVAFVRPGTTEPVALPATESIELGIASGSGTLGGTLQKFGDGSSSLSFDGLTVDTPGPLRIEVRASTSGVPAASSDPFEVSQPLALEFVDAPMTVYANVPYSIEVRVVDDGGQAVAPSFPVEVTLTTTNGRLVVGLVDAAGRIEFEDLSETVAATETGWTLSAFGFFDVSRASVPVEVLSVAGLSVTGSELVGGDFTISGTLVGASSQQPAEPIPDLVVDATSLAGALGGTTTTISTANTFTIGPMQLDEAGDATIEIGGPHIGAPVAIVQRASFAFGGIVEGVTTAFPNEPLGPFAFELSDAAGTVFTGSADPVAWSITRDADGAAVAAGIAAYDGGTARVEPRVAGPGTFTLTVTPGTNPPTVGADFEVSLDVTFDTVDAPGPFVALKSVRVGTDYADSVAFAALDTTVGQSPAYGLLRGALPDGIAVDPVTGDLGGVPTTPGDYEFTLWARQTDGDLQPIRCALAVFAADESDIATPPPDFSAPGPFNGQVVERDEALNFVSSFDGIAYQTAYRIWSPPIAAQPAPVLVFHRTRSVGFDEYSSFATHLASHGIACVSVEDTISFRAPGSSPDSIYDLTVIEAGIESGTAFMEAVAEDVVARTAAAGDPLEGMFDGERLFFGGHARGGGSTHAAHVRSLRNKARGYVYLTAIDLRFSSFTIPPGDPRGTPMYPIEAELPRSPSLVVSFEQDFEVFYPMSDQLPERRTGPNTFVTVYGAVGSYMTDTATYDQIDARITRAEQQARVFPYVVAFIKRWSGDRSLDGLLYGDAAAGSTEVGVFSWRNMVERVLVDDFQDDDAATNLLGGSNTFSVGSRNEAPIYPPFGGFPSLGIKQCILFLSGVDASVYATEFPSLDLARQRRLAFRLGQTTSEGFDWVTIRARLVDSSGMNADVTVWDRLTQTGSLPDFDLSFDSPFDRFVEAQVALAEFVGVDLADVVKVELVFETDGAGDFTRRVYLDDLRFE